MSDFFTDNKFMGLSGLADGETEFIPLISSEDEDIICIVDGDDFLFREDAIDVIDRLYQDCLKLERARIPGKDFVRMLRKELILLKRMHRRYVKSLLV